MRGSNFELRAPDPRWEPPTIVTAPGAFAMPIGPVFSDFAESAHFLLETVGEDVIRTIPRFFYKYRGVEKIAEGQKADRGLAACRAILRHLRLCSWPGILSGRRSRSAASRCHRAAQALRTVFAELERLRHHAAVITGICHSTALAVATSQAALMEENLLRLSCELSGHRYLFGLIKPGGLTRDLSEDDCQHLATVLVGIAERLRKLHQMLRYSSSFLDRLEEVGIITTENAVAYGLVGPIARASGLARDIRKLFPYAAYATCEFRSSRRAGRRRLCAPSHIVPRSRAIGRDHSRHPAVTASRSGLRRSAQMAGGRRTRRRRSARRCRVPLGST